MCSLYHIECISLYSLPSSLSGILEMRGFQTTFSHLFNTSSQENNVSGLNNDTLLTCSSDGDSDFIIVRAD